LSPGHLDYLATMVNSGYQNRTNRNKKCVSDMVTNQIKSDVEPASETSCCTRNMVATVLSIGIREVLGSNISQDTRYPD
jgi:hypothetical protein